jgi:hypothetical protein
MVIYSSGQRGNMRIVTLLFMGFFITNVSYAEVIKSQNMTEILKIEKALIANEKPEEEEEPDCE